MPPDPETFCSVSITVLSAATDSSTWLILSMTFERFYSIIRPHKAASFNTVKRAKVIIVCIVVISALYSLPLLFMTGRNGTTCVPYSKGTDHFAGKLYYWSDQVIGFGFPFVALLTMNTVIIHTLRKRSSLLLTRSDTQDEGQKSRSFLKNEKFRKTNNNNVASCNIWVFNLDVSFLWHDTVHRICRFQFLSQAVCWFLTFHEYWTKNLLHQFWYQFLLVCYIW